MKESVEGVEDDSGDVGEVEDEGGVMETDTDKAKFSKKYLERLSKAWKDRHHKRKRKRLSNSRKRK